VGDAGQEIIGEGPKNSITKSSKTIKTLDGSFPPLLPTLDYSEILVYTIDISFTMVL
jgi:hypothetical protein